MIFHGGDDLTMNFQNVFDGLFNQENRKINSLDTSVNKSDVLEFGMIKEEYRDIDGNQHYHIYSKEYDGDTWEVVRNEDNSAPLEIMELEE